MKPQRQPDHYFNKSYDSKNRFISYWYQINEIMNLEPNSILEIGVGNGLVSDYLKQRKFNVTTMDVDKLLKPDKVGSVLEIPFPNGYFEVIACFEVLEHLPYKDFPKALREIFRVSSKNAILSLPDQTRTYRIDIQIPKYGGFKKLISLPRLKTPKHIFDGEHHWEIGKAGYQLKRVMSDICSAGFKIKKTYQLLEVAYYRFFILKN